MNRVSTHSRPKAADANTWEIKIQADVSTHSRPKAAALFSRYPVAANMVSTHSRPKAAVYTSSADWISSLFQHTAARRRLCCRRTAVNQINGFNTQPPEGGWAGQRQALQSKIVSTHSRPKAAVQPVPTATDTQSCFNTQPPEGGCV